MTGPILVLGYGNTLRGDDGVGPAVAEAVASWGLPHVRAEACHQLVPELIDVIATARLVILVDAEIGTGEVRTRPVVDSTEGDLLGHHFTPSRLLGMARELHGCCPECLLLTIPVKELTFGETFSGQARQGIEEALRQIRSLVNPSSSSPS
jgi:hydrogenase maturation protease